MFTLRRFSSTLTTLCLLLTLAAHPAAAQQITVNVSADNTISGDGACTLREAINNANAGQQDETTGGDCQAGGVHDKLH